MLHIKKILLLLILSSSGFSQTVSTLSKDYKNGTKEIEKGEIMEVINSIVRGNASLEVIATQVIDFTAFDSEDGAFMDVKIGDIGEQPMPDPVVETPVTGVTIEELEATIYRYYVLRCDNSIATIAGSDSPKEIGSVWVFKGGDNFDGQTGTVTTEVAGIPTTIFEATSDCIVNSEPSTPVVVTPDPTPTPDPEVETPVTVVTTEELGATIYRYRVLSCDNTRAAIAGSDSPKEIGSVWVFRGGNNFDGQTGTVISEDPGMPTTIFAGTSDCIVNSEPSTPVVVTPEPTPTPDPVVETPETVVTTEELGATIYRYRVLSCDNTRAAIAGSDSPKEIGSVWEFKGGVNFDGRTGTVIGEDPGMPTTIFAETSDCIVNSEPSTPVVITPDPTPTPDPVVETPVTVVTTEELGAAIYRYRVLNCDNTSATIAGSNSPKEIGSVWVFRGNNFDGQTGTVIAEDPGMPTTIFEGTSDCIVDSEPSTPVVVTPTEPIVEEEPENEECESFINHGPANPHLYAQRYSNTYVGNVIAKSTPEYKIEGLTDWKEMLTDGTTVVDGSKTLYYLSEVSDNQSRSIVLRTREGCPTYRDIRVQKVIENTLEEWTDLPTDLPAINPKAIDAYFFVNSELENKELNSEMPFYYIYSNKRIQNLMVRINGSGVRMFRDLVSPLFAHRDNEPILQLDGSIVNKDFILDVTYDNFNTAARYTVYRNYQGGHWSTATTLTRHDGRVTVNVQGINLDVNQMLVNTNTGQEFNSNPEFGGLFDVGYLPDGEHHFALKTSNGTTINHRVVVKVKQPSIN